MKNSVKYFLVIFLFVFDVNLVTGSEKWSEDREKMLGKFVDVNRRMRSRDKEYNLFKIKVMEMFEQYQNEIDELKGSLHRKQTRIDQLENSESIKDQELQKLRIQVQEMAIQGMEM